MSKNKPLTNEEERLKDFDQSVFNYFKNSEETRPLHESITPEDWNKIFVEIRSLGFKLLFDEEYTQERKEEAITRLNLAMS